MKYALGAAEGYLEHTRHTLSAVLLSCLMAVSGNAATAQDEGDKQSLVFSSGLQRTTLIELYTSEGCSSCPPAEAYLNGLKDHPQLWRSYIPMAFHVDYWDYLGWQDPYARASYSKRQRRYARYHRARTVYTPAFFVNGEPWRNSSMDDMPSVEAAKVGQLRLELSGEQLTLDFEPSKDVQGALSYNIALLGMGLESSIKRGERAGANAKHEFVVLKRLTHTSGDLRWTTTVPNIQDRPVSGYAMVAWVSAEDAPAPLQATGGYIPQAMFD